MTQRGPGQSDGNNYLHDSEPKGVILTVECDLDRNQWFFARLSSRDRDDFLGWFIDDAGDHRSVITPF